MPRTTKPLRATSASKPLSTPWPPCSAAPTCGPGSARGYQSSRTCPSSRRGTRPSSSSSSTAPSRCLTRSPSPRSPRAPAPSTCGTSRSSPPHLPSSPLFAAEPHLRSAPPLSAPLPRSPLLFPALRSSSPLARSGERDGGPRLRSPPPERAARRPESSLPPFRARTRARRRDGCVRHGLLRRGLGGYPHTPALSPSNPPRPPLKRVSPFLRRSCYCTPQLLTVNARTAH